MAWTSPHTFVTGELVTASLLNVHLRDNIQDRYDNGGVLHAHWRLSGVITPTAISGTVDNWNPTGLATACRIRIDGASGTDLTGVVAQPTGQTILVQNIGSNAITVHHGGASSTAANRFTTPTAANLTFNSGTMQLWSYDATLQRWWVGILT